MDSMANEDSGTAVVVQAQKPATVAPIHKAALTVPSNDGIAGPFSSESAFVAAQRMASALSASTLVPREYQKNISNCLIAMELASRIGVSVLATMQNLHIIQGRPSWSAAFLIATVNASGRFTPLRYEWAGEPGKDTWSCRAVARDIRTGELCEGTWITWQMAGKEGWTKKSGSKWLTMPQQMFVYRAASFWCRMYCPEISIGFQTTEEVQDTTGHDGVDDASMPAVLTPAGAKALEAVLGIQENAVEAAAGEPEQPSQGEAPLAEAVGRQERHKRGGEAKQTSLVDGQES